MTPAVRKCVSASVAALACLALSGPALGAGDYTPPSGVAGGVTYSSAPWELNARFSTLWNGYYSQNIGNALVDLYKNGVGLVNSNYPGTFLYNNDSVTVNWPDIGVTYVSKCKSSNTRSNAGCSH